MKIRYGQHSDRGLVRSENQDTLGMTPEATTTLEDSRGVLFVVADGMGGHRAGRHASELAVSTIISTFSGAESDALPGLLSSAMNEANSSVYQKGSSSPAFSGMGTTCTVLVLQGSSAWVAHVGDSKAFLVTESHIRQITTDHTRVWDLYSRGVITRDQARIHPERNLLTRALGLHPHVDMELVGPLELMRGIRFVLCTDGLTNHVEEGEIHEVVVRTPPDEGVLELVSLANARGGSDNISVQIVELSAE